MTRADALDRLARERFDLLVVGGGIVGAGVAALAARHGLAVALVDRGDFGSATSSASSKLVHGGLRYLRTGGLDLVREALQEVDALSSVVAPHLVRRREFVLPIYDSGPYGRLSIRAALLVYSGFTGHRRSSPRILRPAEAARLVPPLRLDGLRGAGLYADAQTDDARLCLANVRAAAEAGAAVANYAELVALGAGGGEVVDRIRGGTIRVAARAVVNAAGPWVDEVRRLEDPCARPSVTLSKGVHLVLERRQAWDAAVTIPVDRTRVSFAIPWLGMLLLGTTDTAWEGDPAAVDVTAEDERQVLAEAAAAVAVDTADVRHRFAGLRVLPLTAGDTASARRELVLSRGPRGVLSVAGGKLTTYRRIALAVLDSLAAELALHRLDRAPRPLPGATVPEVEAAALLRREPALGRRSAEHLARSHGLHAREVLARAAELPDGLEPLAPGAPDLVAEALYARDVEWAVTVDDVLRRRTTVTLRGADSPAVRARVAALLAPAAGGEPAAAS